MRLIDADKIHCIKSDDLSLSPNDVREILESCETVNPLQEVLEKLESQRKQINPHISDYSNIDYWSVTNCMDIVKEVMKKYEIDHRSGSKRNANAI